MRPERKKPNPIARDLRSPKYRRRVFAKKKGTASYQRSSNRRPDASRDGGFDSRGCRIGFRTGRSMGAKAFNLRRRWK